MHNLTRVALAGVFALGIATTAAAQSPQIPTPANTNPLNPVATDGSPLPHDNTANAHGLLTGRSAFVGPVGGIVGTGVDAAGSAVDLGVGVAGHAVDSGLSATGAVVNGSVDAAGQIVR